MPDSDENSKAFLHSSSGASLGPLTFEEIFGNVSTLHADKELAGSLFQVASQFNVLEMVSPDVGPEEGVTCYQHDRTQGPACAMACPAATVFRFEQRCAFLTPHTSHLTPCVQPHHYCSGTTSCQPLAAWALASACLSCRSLLASSITASRLAAHLRHLTAAFRSTA